MSKPIAKDDSALIQAAKTQTQANRYAFLRKAAAKRAIRQALKRR